MTNKRTKPFHLSVMAIKLLDKKTCPEGSIFKEVFKLFHQKVNVTFTRFKPC